MNLAFEIDLDPDLERVLKDLDRSVEDVTAKLVKTIAEDAPAEMAALMPEGGGSPSTKGSPPNRQSGRLVRELKGRVVNATEAEILMANHAYYLDPLFEGEPDGGGYLNRPFIEQGVIRSLSKIL